MNNKIVAFSQKSVQRKNENERITYEIFERMKVNSADSFSEGLAKVEILKKFGFIDIKGKVIIPLLFYNVKSFSDGFAVAQKKPNFFERLFKKKLLPYGLIDKTGEFAIPAIYEEIEIVHKFFVKAKINKETIIYW